MALLVGTRDGVYRAPNVPFDEAEAEPVLDAGRVLRVRTFDSTAGVFAATGTGLFRSLDGGESWENLGVPREEVYSVAVSPDGNHLFAGTHPAHVYRSTVAEIEWTELEGFQDLPSREEWHTPRHRNEAHVRSLGAPVESPHRVVAGVEVGGVHVSDDDGDTWTERRVEGFDVPHADDVHHVHLRDGETYVASTGSGLYRTGDAGRSWTRLDEDVEQRYFREAYTDDGVLYAAAAYRSPGTWDDDARAALFESTDGGDTLEAVDYPGEGEEVVLAWTTHNRRVVAGTHEGRVIERTGDGWRDAGRVPHGVASLAAR